LFYKVLYIENWGELGRKWGQLGRNQNQVGRKIGELGREWGETYLPSLEPCVPTV